MQTNNEPSNNKDTRKVKIQENHIKELRARLKKHYGSIAEIAKRTKKTSEWIGRMLRNQERLNLDVIKIALEVCEEYEDAEEKKEQIILEKMKNMKIA